MPAIYNAFMVICVLTPFFNSKAGGFYWYISHIIYLIAYKLTDNIAVTAVTSRRIILPYNKQIASFRAIDIVLKRRWNIRSCFSNLDCFFAVCYLFAPFRMYAY